MKVCHLLPWWEQLDGVKRWNVDQRDSIELGRSESGDGIKHSLNNYCSEEDQRNMVWLMVLLLFWSIWASCFSESLLDPLQKRILLKIWEASESTNTWRTPRWDTEAYLSAFCPALLPDCWPHWPMEHHQTLGCRPTGVVATEKPYRPLHAFLLLGAIPTAGCVWLF